MQFKAASRENTEVIYFCADTLHQMQGTLQQENCVVKRWRGSPRRAGGYWQQHLGFWHLRAGIY